MSCQPRFCRSNKHHTKPKPKTINETHATAKRSNARGHGNAPPSAPTTRKRHARMPIVWPPRAHEITKYAAVIASSAERNASRYVTDGCATSTAPCEASRTTPAVNIHSASNGKKSYSAAARRSQSEAGVEDIAARNRVTLISVTV